ncbi:MAG: hypothetical protein ACD_29C00093G0002 [uncultured bacterium]|nr:MAG: hypothetical protein ACD_29C00093G0002 [uncultured bacterium]OGT46923.1 MAG: hypothetical protein A3E82_02630 [Gammaproteobacteria bacterium RIFCSPHIGHO2_12_FULL_38_11]
MKKILILLSLIFAVSSVQIAADPVLPENNTALISGNCVAKFKILESENCTVTYTATNGITGKINVTNVQPNCWFVLGFPTSSAWKGKLAAAGFKAIKQNGQIVFQLIAGNYIFHIRPFITSNSVNCTTAPNEQCSINFRWKPFQGSATCDEFLQSYEAPST